MNRSSGGSAYAARRTHAGILVLLVLLVLGAGGLLALWTARDYGSQSQRLEASVGVVDAYIRAHEAVAVLAEVENDYRESPTASMRQRFRAADVRLAAALADLRADGGPTDRQLAAEAERARRRYVRAMEDQFRLVSDGRSESAIDAHDDAFIDPSADRLVAAVNEQAPVSAWSALDDIHRLRLAATRSFSVALALLVGLAVLLAGVLVFAVVAQMRRRRAEEARRSTERRHRRVLETSHDAYVAFSADGSIREWNAKAGELFGLGGGAPALVQEFLAESRQERVEDVLARLAEGAEPGGVTASTILRRPDGSSFAADLSLWETDADGERFYNAFVRDVDARVRLEEELRQAQKMDAIGQLAGGIAHDFNNVLTMIAGSGELARYELEPGHPARPEVDGIIAAVERGAALTRQLLTFSRRRTPALTEVDVAAALRETGALLNRVVGSEIDLRVEVAADSGTVRLEEGQLDQIVINLVVNARDAIGGKPGSIAVLAEHVASAGEDRVRIRVSDSGAGMDAETRARIFEPFFTTKPEGSGTGLGLSTVYGIVTQADGQLTVESEPGRGTTFTVELPRAGAGSLTAAA